MGWLKEFNDLHYSTRAIAISVAILMPFWYLDLYLLSPRMITGGMPVQIPIIVSFCLAASWVFTNLGLIALIETILPEDANTEVVKDIHYKRVMLLSVMFAVITMGLFTVVGYLCKLRFHVFVYGAFMVLILLYCIRFFIFWYGSKQSLGRFD